jgi:hypothetical protein
MHSVWLEGIIEVLCFQASDCSMKHILVGWLVGWFEEAECIPQLYGVNGEGVEVTV